MMTINSTCFLMVVSTIRMDIISTGMDLISMVAITMRRASTIQVKVTNTNSKHRKNRFAMLTKIMLNMMTRMIRSSHIINTSKEDNTINHSNMYMVK